MALSDFFSSPQAYNYNLDLGQNFSKVIPQYYNAPANFNPSFNNSDVYKYNYGASSPDFSSYWNPPSSDITGSSGQDFAKTFAKTFAKNLVDSSDKWQKMLQNLPLQQEQQQEKTAGGMAVSGEGWGSKQLTSNLSELSYGGPSFTLAGVQGGPGFLDSPIGRIATGVGGMLLGPAIGALGSSLGTSLGSSLFGAGKGAAAGAAAGGVTYV